MRANLPDDEQPTDSPILSEPSGRGSLDWFNDNTSHSGHEKNHLFVNNLGSGRGELFTDVSGISGVNSAADARASIVWDYDRDGFTDLATVNANAPKLEIWRNRYAELAPDVARTTHFLALRFEGGNRTSSPEPGFSARDGYGALVEVTLGRDKEAVTLYREHRAGEGFAAQNSATMHVGLGHHEKAARVRVRWPSGKVTTLLDVPSGSLATLREAGEATVESYVLPTQPADPAPLPLEGEHKAELVMYTTMTTTCASCRAELPELVHLRDSFSETELSMVGLPMDVDETRDELVAWEERFSPVYELKKDFSGEERESMRALILEKLKLEATLTTIVTDRKGNLHSIHLGAPTVSSLKKLLAGH